METKGSKNRDIRISRKFMAELYRYVTKVRGERASLGKDQKALLLNHLGEPYGSAGKSLNRIISETGKLVGVEVHAHMLRHTYATHTLVNLQRNPQKGIQTTMIYLHLINEMADEAVLAYDDELNEMAGAV
jgi:site-specific recombinase XerD